MQHDKPIRLSEKGTIAMSLVTETLALARLRGLDTAPLAEAAGQGTAAPASPRAPPACARPAASPALRAALRATL